MTPDPATPPTALPHLPAGWSARVPVLDDVPALLRLRGADRAAYTGSSSVDPEAIGSEVAGPASWTRRQLVVLDPGGNPVGWLSVHVRAAGRTMVALYLDRRVDEAAGVAAALYAWAEVQAGEIAALRGVSGTRLDASPCADDTVQRGWLADAGYEKRRTWLQMSRPVTPEEATALPGPRAGVTVRRVASHENGLPVAGDLHLVHEMLESSFEDHFNSYRESFPEFLQRLREDPGHRWDHWWLASVEDDEGRPVPGGALVGTVTGAGPSGREGSYVEYIGVHRRARGRGVAKALLFAVIADAAQRGRDRIGLEVDADSPTGADGLYRSLGWETAYALESWFKDVQFD